MEDKKQNTIKPNEELLVEKNDSNLDSKNIEEAETKREEKTVDINIENVKEKDEPIEIKFKGGGMNKLKSFVGEKTKEHELAEDSEKEEKEEKTDSDEGELIGKYISEDEYKLIAKVLINLIDTVIVNIFKFWSGDMKDSSYGLNKPKINELADILSKILKKRNVKWSLELLFVFMLVLGYAQNAKQAYEFRKDNKKSKDALSVVSRKKVTIIDTDNGQEEEIQESYLQKEKRGAKPKSQRHMHQRKNPRAFSDKELYANAVEA